MTRRSERLSCPTRRPRSCGAAISAAAPTRTLGTASMAVASMAAVLGCASLPPCPAKGGPAWHELSTEHFVVRSDLDLDRSLDVLRTLEETRAAMLVGVWNGAAGPTRPIQVVALASRSEFSAFADHSLVGVHVRRPPFPPMLVITGAFTSGKDTAKHELAHDLSFHMLPIEPRWYAEGIATYLETTRYDREQGRAILGEIAEDRYRFLQVGGGLMSSEDLWKPVPDDLMDVSRFYATSWLLVHYLMNHRPEQFARFQHRLGAISIRTN
jgi:hypothetical protein